MKKGFEDARLGDVARAAGVSPAAIYRFAPSRDELLADVLRRVSAKERDAFRRMLSVHANVRDAIRAATHQFVVRAYTGNAIAGVLLSGPAAPAVDRARAETRALLADVIHDRLRDRVRAIAIVGALLAMLADALEAPSREREKRATEISSMCEELASRPGDNGGCVFAIDCPW